MKKEVIVKESVILTDMELAQTIAMATYADCFHNDEKLDLDECNGWPAYSCLENNLTGRVKLENDEHKGAYVEMNCPQCGNTSWTGDGEFFDYYKILLDSSSGYYEIEHIN